jgi:hypothetical protein
MEPPRQEEPNSESSEVEEIDYRPGSAKGSALNNTGCDAQKESSGHDQRFQKAVRAEIHVEESSTIQAICFDYPSGQCEGE